MNPKNHRPLLLACCLALATCVILPATACRELFPDKGYIARVWIRVPMSRPDTVFRVPDAEPPFTTARDEVIAMFHSDSVLESAFVLPGISDLGCLEGVADKTGWLRERLGTKYIGNSEILEVTITGKDPEDLKKLVSAVCQAFIEEKRLQDDPGELALEEGSYEMGKEKLAEKRLQYQALVEETGMQNSEEAKELNKGMIERIEKLRDQVQLILVEKVGLDRRIELLEERLKNTPEEIAGRLREELDAVKIDKEVEQAKVNFAMNDFQQNMARSEKRREDGEKLDALLAEIAGLEKSIRGIENYRNEVEIQAAAESRMQIIGEPTVQKL